MYFSKHNIVSKIAGTDQYILLNILSGSADIISAREAEGIIKGQYLNVAEFSEKGYLTDPETEEKRFRQKYIEFIENRDTDEVQLFFVPNYSCNFGCAYCYQDEYSNNSLDLSTDVIDAFFNYVDNQFKNRKKYITLFGGEPLLPGENHKKLITYFVQKTTGTNLDLAVVSNGYHLPDYIPIFKTANIREIQITLDGTEEIHNRRRPLKNGSPTFHQIVQGIDLALHENMPVNMRIVIDKDNIENLPELSTFAIEKGWTTNPLFKTQIGRNYELHHCQANNQRLFSRLSLYEKIYHMIQKYPHIINFYQPAYSVSKFLFEEGKLPSPLFDSCPGTKTEWAFDYTGNFYACTATVGKAGEELGRFYPHVELKSEMISEWEDRDILSIEMCRNCSVQLACGGGCSSLAKNKTGKLHSPDCRPAKELIGLGTALYFKDVLNV